MNTDGTGFSVLHSFSAYDTGTINNSDGASPQGEGPGLILLGNTLYGTATDGGANGGGTVFALGTNGANFTVIYSLSTDGGLPYSGLVASGNVLYGAATYGGSSGNGTIFSISLPSAISPPPQLTIIPGFGNLVLTWATNATGFNLQSTTNLGPSAVWTTDTPPPVVVNGQNSVTNPMARFQQFFRLTR